MKITCIDFETANPMRASACSVGTAVFLDGRFAGSEEHLILPHPTRRYFDPFYIQIHGITPEMTASAPEFDKLSDRLFGILDADLVIAHNAVFDITLLHDLCELYGLACPRFRYFCTCKASRRLWPEMTNHKLDTLCAAIGYEFRHHDAEADAEAAGRVLFAMMRSAGTDTPFELADRLSIETGELSSSVWTPCRCLPRRKKKS